MTDARHRTAFRRLRDPDRNGSRLPTVARVALWTIGFLVFVPPSAAANPEIALRPTGVVLPGPSDWVATEGDLVAWGAGDGWRVAGRDGTLLAQGTFEGAADDAVLARGRLYVSRQGAVGWVDPFEAGSVPHPVGVDLHGDAPILLERVHDYLVAVERGVGIHLLTLPPPEGVEPAAAGAQHAHAWSDEHRTVAFVPFASDVTATAAAGKVVYLALRGGGIAPLDVTDPPVPSWGSTLATGSGVEAMSANGGRLLVIGDRGLRRFDLEEGGIPASGIASAIETGTDLEWRGRSVLVADGENGVAAYVDRSTVAATHFVTVTNFSFVPDTLTVQAGDTVQWDNTNGTHDTDSCDVGETGCPSASTESWDSGPPTTAPWTFSHTFTVPGPNPYTCTLHAGVGMVGSITVEAAAAAPPAVPDGDGATVPLALAKADIGGDALEFSFDDASCPEAADTQVLAGTSAELPAAPGGTYDVSFARCDCGTTSPCTWSDTPDPGPGDFVWFVMTATDGGTIEGSWGTDSAGNDRSGPGIDGNSGRCGVSERDTTNTCGR